MISSTAVDADNAELRSRLEASDAFDAYCRSALAVIEKCSERHGG